MLAKIYSAAVYGVEAFPIEIEVNESRGDPQMDIVGLPDTAVKESRYRVLTAIHNSGFASPKGRLTVNLAPADIKKEGPIFDLPIALGTLATQMEVQPEALKEIAAVGELALSGEVRRIKGALPITLTMKKKHRKSILVPVENAEESAVVEGINVFPIRTLREAQEIVMGLLNPAPSKIDIKKVFETHSLYEEDFSDVKGQEQAKRAIEVAVAGGHNIIMIGPPGSGKTMLARRIPSILPQMTLEEALDITRIHSISGALLPHQALVAKRPFRAPHHTISDAGLLGGGTYPMPGEVSLAHCGVLFLDELPEFHRNVLEVMRQPLEDGFVTISRASASLTFPCRFMLVAAMNPCPCGYAGDRKRECRCTGIQIQNYRNKISGPLLDRIDIHIEVPSVPYQTLSSEALPESSAVIRQRVITARLIQQERFKGLRKVHCNAEMRSKELQKICHLNKQCSELLKEAIESLNLSARAYDRIIKVSRTIADLDKSSEIEPHHISEAIQYRTLDRNFWI
jgi:magnesium chelatase family protein